ncbi:condensation domain-containing protein [Acrasis kona]|uniref:Condensation domain-containing protein n=1 Tax=Acrasis kona TaxID=1008807 RepID=A0AAW2YZ04_9EUKA
MTFHTGETLRPLNPIEEIFYLQERASSIAPSFLLQIEGTKSEVEWKHAIKQVQNVHPLLSTKITKALGKRPVFTKTDDEIEIEFCKWNQEFDVKAELSKSFERVFWSSNGPLLHLKIFSGLNKTFIIGHGCHTAFDAMGYMILIDDMLSFAGKHNYKKHPYEFQPESQVYKKLNLTLEHEYTSKKLEESDLTQGLNRTLTLPVHIYFGSLTEYELKSLIQQCRSRNTTLHGLLVSAFATTGYKRFKEWQLRPPVFTTPANVRPIVGLPDIPGNLIYNVITPVMDLDKGDVWSTALQVNKDVHSGVQFESALAAHQGAKETVSKEMSPKEVTKITDYLCGDMMVSNYGPQKIVQHDYGDLKLSGVRMSSVIDVPKVDIMTFNKESVITLATRKPEEGWLEEAVNVLRNQIK